MHTKLIDRLDSLPDGEVVIRYGIEKVSSGGWVPVFLRSWESYYSRKNTSSPAYGRDEAQEAALKQAQEEKSKYAGDWLIQLLDLGEV